METQITLDDLMAIQDGVFIAMPMGEQARYNNYWSTFLQVLTPPRTIRQGLFGIYIADLQNKLARMFLSTDCQWFWIVNDDQIYPRETLIALMKRNKDIVIPLCLEKNAPHAPLLYERRLSDGTHPFRYMRRGDHGLVEIGAGAGGGMLIHRRVLETLPDPWWTVQTVISPVDGKPGQTSEDFDFCDKAIEAGFRIWADLDVSVAHMATYGVRAVVDPDGEWFTSLMRQEEQVIIPPAVSPAGRMEAAQRQIQVPERMNW